jgi:hypothetical protein
MGLGSFNTVSLRGARDRAEECRNLLQRGKDPIAERDAERAATAQAKTIIFEKAAEEFIADKDAGWRNAKHRQQWRNTLTTYAYQSSASWTSASSTPRW